MRKHARMNSIPYLQAIIAHVVHLVNRDYAAMCQDYYALQFMDRSVDTSPIAPALATFFNDVLDRSVQELNFKARARRPPGHAARAPCCVSVSAFQGPRGAAMLSRILLF